MGGLFVKWDEGRSGVEVRGDGPLNVLYESKRVELKTKGR
jgi:hypothetical protein